MQMNFNLPTSIQHPCTAVDPRDLPLEVMTGEAIRLDSVGILLACELSNFSRWLRFIYIQYYLFLIIFS